MSDTSVANHNPTAKSSARLSAYLPKRIYRYLGYAFLFAWFSVLFTSSILVDPNRLFAPMSTTHQYAMAATAVIAFVVALFAHRLAPAEARPGLGIIAGVIGSIGTALIVASYSVWYSPALTAGGFIVVSFAMVWLSVAWQEAFAEHGVRTAVILLVLSTFLSILIFFGLAIIPQSIAMPISVLLPLAAAFSFPYRKNLRKPALSNEVTSASESTPRSHSQSTENVSAKKQGFSNSWLKRAPYKLLILVLLVSIASGAMRTTGVFHDLDFTFADQWIGFGLSATLSIILGCIAAFYSHKRSISLAFYIALPTAAIGCIMLATLPPAYAALAQTLLSIGAELVRIMVWILLIDQAFIRKNPSLGVFSLLLSAQYAGFFIGQALGVNPKIPLDVLTYLSLLLCLVSALLLVSMQGKLVVSTEALTGPSIDVFEQRIETLAHDANLTPRETEVMSIWAAGHNSAYIEETLHISKHTVKTHLVHIYEKTGTANREELLSLLEQKG